MESILGVFTFIQISSVSSNLFTSIWVSKCVPISILISTQDKSIAQLSVCTRLCTMACLLCKLPAFPSFGMRLGDTTLTYTNKTKQKKFHWSISSNSRMKNSKLTLNISYMHEFEGWVKMYVGEPGGAVLHGQVQRRVVGLSDGPL